MVGPANAIEPPSASQPPVERGRSALVAVVLAVVVASAGILVVTWWATRLHDTTIATGLAIGGTVVGALLVALVARRSSNPGAGRRFAIGATVVAGLVVVVLSWTGALVSAKATRSQAAWQQTVDQVLAKGAERGSEQVATAVPCVWGPQIRFELRELAGFGRVDSICSSAQPGQRFVHLVQDDSTYPGAGGRRTGLVYAPDTADPLVKSICAQHLDGPWWLTASADPNCPPGFTFIGAP